MSRLERLLYLLSFLCPTTCCLVRSITTERSILRGIYMKFKKYMMWSQVLFRYYCRRSIPLRPPRSPHFDGNMEEAFVEVIRRLFVDRPWLGAFASRLGCFIIMIIIGLRRTEWTYTTPHLRSGWILLHAASSLA